jgi:geranylgeranyl pyrophosphate synthase
MELTLSIEKSSFDSFLLQHKLIIEEYLDKILPKAHKNAHMHLFQALRYSVLNNGKRLRPILIYAIGEILGTPIEKLHAAAASIELIHCYSLVHDDLPAMDDDDLRRGLPTCHKAFDEATAILVGDALQTLAFQILSDAELNPVTAQQQISMVNILAKASGAAGMVLGQAEDLAAEQRQLSLNELITLHQHKTGALFNACIELSILACPQQVDSELADSLRSYGKHLGLAFQIQDDVLDVIGTEEKIGKPIGSDQKNAKSTFTSLLGLETAQAQATENLDLALQSIATFGATAQTLTELAKFIVARDS